MSKIHLYKVGAVLQPNEHFGYSVIINIKDHVYEVCTDFGNIFNLTEEEVLKIKPVWLFEYGDFVCCQPSVSVVERYKKQLENMKRVGERLKELGILE